MRRCPACDSLRVALRLDAAGVSRCLRCSTAWVQQGSTQRVLGRPSIQAPKTAGITKCRSCGRTGEPIRDPAGRWAVCSRCGALTSSDPTIAPA